MAVSVTCVACLRLLDVRRVGRGNQSAASVRTIRLSIFHKSAPLVRVVMETNASQSRHNAGEFFLLVVEDLLVANSFLF